MYKFTIFLFIFLLFISCSSSKQEDLLITEEDLTIETQNQKAKELFESGSDFVRKGSYKRAIEDFEEIERLYPFSDYAIRSTRMIAYAYYQNADYDDALNVIDKFISLNPGNEHIAYMYYLRALSTYNQIGDIKRDSSSAQLALKTLDDVLVRFPKSDYAKDVKQKKLLVLDHLAGKEMEVGRFYLKHDNFISAINRFQKVVRNYQNTKHLQEALYRLVEANLSIGLKDEARKTAAVLGHNYPDSIWYEYAYELMVKNNYNPADESFSRDLEDVCKNLGINC